MTPAPTSSSSRAGAWAVLDQCLISGTNFLTGWMLARYCEPAEYGGWAMAFSAMLLLNALQTALITGPLMILGPQRSDASLTAFAGALGIAQAALTLGMALVAALAALLMDGAMRQTAAAMALALLLVQGHEFFRRVLYARLLTLRVLGNDIVSCGLQITGLFTLLHSGGISPAAGGAGLLSGRNAFLLLAATSAIGFLCGLFQARQFVSVGRGLVAGPLRETWSFSRWGLGTLLGDSLYQQGTLAAAVTFSGPAGAAMVEAPRLLLAPLNILVFSGNNMFSAVISRHLTRHGPASMPAMLRRLGSLWLIPVVGYPLLVLAAPGLWLDILYRGKYSGAVEIVQLWAVSQCLFGLRVLPWIFVNVMRRSDLLMYASLSSGILAMSAAPVLIQWIGPGGAVGGRLLADLAMLAAAALVVARLFRGDAPPIKQSGAVTTT